MPTTSVYPPITLPLNKWLGALTCLVGYVQVAQTNRAGESIPLLNVTADVNVPNGNGKMVVSADVLEVKEYSQVSSLLTVTNPTVAEQYIKLTDFKTIPLTINNYLMRLSFLSATDTSYYIGYILSMMNVSKNIDMYRQMVKTIEDWTPTPFDESKSIGSGKRGQKTSVVEIEQYDVSKTTDPNSVNTLSTFNSNKIYKAVLDYIPRLSSPTSEYNEQGITQFVPRDEIWCFINSRFQNELTINTLATLLNSPKIANNKNNVSRYIEIPDVMFSEENRDKIILFLGHRRKFQWGYFYSLATSFFDGSNLMLNHWLQYAYYMATVDAYPMLKFTAKVIAPPSGNGTSRTSKKVEQPVPVENA